MNEPCLKLDQDTISLSIIIRIIVVQSTGVFVVINLKC